MPRRVLQGVVVSHSDKTAKVLVTRSVLHARYDKIIKRSKNYLVHDEDNAVNIGDVVRFIESAPISKRKSWKII